VANGAIEAGETPRQGGCAAFSSVGIGHIGVRVESDSTLQFSYKSKQGRKHMTEQGSKTTAPQILTKAKSIMEDRAATYDQPSGERSMGRAVVALNVILGRAAITESEGWLLMQILKDVRDRQRTTPHIDSLEDGVAYSALKAEARMAEASDL
jgi:hypothetical protein